MALFWRIWAAVTLVNFAVLTIFVVLATLQFGNINSALVGERLVVLAGRTAAPFEAAARIGLPLSTVRNAEALLERARQTDDAIRAIHVFDAAGRIVRSTAKPAPAEISQEAAAARRDAKGGTWHLETAEGFLGSIDITSRTGGSAGGILIVYPGDRSTIRLRAMGADLGLLAIAVFLASAVASALLLRLGLVRQIRFFGAVEGTILAFERSAWRGATGQPVTTDGTGEEYELRRLLNEAEARYLAVSRAFPSRRDAAQ